MKHVGLSNCYIQHLEVLHTLITSSVATAGKEVSPSEVPLAPIYAVQNYMDAAHHEADLLNFCIQHHIHCLAYRSLAFMSVYGLLDGVLEDIQEVAKTQGLDSGHQLVLYWLLSRGVCPVVSSVDRAHMMTNYAVCSRYQQHLQTTQQGEVERGANTPAGSSLDEVMRKVAAQSEMIDMMGGSDEYSLAFKAMKGADDGEGV